MAPKYSTLQQKNGFKLQLLREKNEEYLLILFHKKFPTDPKKLNAELQKHQATIKLLLKRKLLKQDKYDLLFPASQQTDSQKFDVTLLFLLIRTLCGYKEPTTGWHQEPDENDRTEIANAIRLKLGRNLIQHGKVSISTQEYNSIYRYLRQPLLDLGCPKAEIDNLMISIRYDIPTKANNFVGREDEINKLDETFNKNKLAAVVSGIPGIGKSELAKQYCHRNSQAYDHVIWINASNLESTYVDIAKILQFHDQSSTKVIAKLLEEYFKDDKVLFIFDNCTDIDILSDVLFHNHDNIITTQIKHWANCYEVIHLDTWTPDNALQYLKDCNMVQEPDLLNELMKELGYHPLGIQHAIAFITEAHISLQEYLVLLREETLDVLIEEVVLDQGVPRSVIASFLITIKKLESDKPETFQLMSIMSVLDGSFMNEEYLERCYKKRLDYIKAKKTLLKYSMMQCNERLKEFTNEKVFYLTMHSLYQHSIKYYTIEYKKSLKSILSKCLEMMTSTLKVVNDENCLSEAKIWVRHLLHLLKQKHFQNVFKETLTFQQYNAVYNVLNNTEAFKVNLKVADILIEHRKSNLQDPVNYLAQIYKLYHMGTSGKISNQEKDAQLELVAVQLENYIKDPKMKKELIDKVVLYSHKREGMLDLMCHLTVEGIYHKDPELFMKHVIPAQRGVFYKETKRYTKALQMLYQSPEFFSQDFISKVQIGCCYILQGDEKKGVKVIESVAAFENHGFSILDVGRAYFDAGFYERSRDYFLKFFKLRPAGAYSAFAVMPLLDGLCKISILGLPDAIFPPSGYNANITFREDLLSNCRFIRRGRIYNINLILKHIQTNPAFNQSNRKRICEPLIMAYHLKKRHEYHKAMLIYQLIERLQNEFGISIHESVVHMEVDVQDEIRICIQSLKRIFKF